VRAVIGDVAEVLYAKVVKQGLKLSVTVDESVPAHVSGDPLRLRQIVLNLVGNAVKFTEHGTIEIRAHWSDAAELRIEVEDSGIGIDPTQIDQLFEIFTQADSSDARRFSGTGLGLSICRRLIQLMGGKIGVRSSVGEGSTFWFTVPATIIEAPSPAPAAAPAERQWFDAKVLLVEDDRVARYVVEKMLMKEGCTVESAKDGREAVAAVAAGEYDLLFMDCQMPIMDGYEATARIRNLEGKQRRTPIIAMTASVMPGQREKCRAQAPRSRTPSGIARALGELIANRQRLRVRDNMRAKPSRSSASAAAFASPWTGRRRGLSRLLGSGHAEQPALRGNERRQQRGDGVVEAVRAGLER